MMYVDFDEVRSVWRKSPKIVQNMVPRRLKRWAWRRLNSQRNIHDSSPLLKNGSKKEIYGDPLIEAINLLPKGDIAIPSIANAVMERDVSYKIKSQLVTDLVENGFLSEGENLMKRIINELSYDGRRSSSQIIRSIKKSDLYLRSISNIPFDSGAPSSKRRGRILYAINNSLPHYSNGYSMRSKGVIRGLESAGFDVLAVTRAGYPYDLNAVQSPTVGDWDEVDGIRYYRIKNPTLKDPGTHDYYLLAADAWENVIRTHQPELVIAASNHRTALPALIAARRCCVPFVYEVRGFWEITRVSREPEYEKTLNYKAQMALESRVSSEADHVLTLNNSMRAELVSRGARADKVSLFPNSVEEVEFPLVARNNVLSETLGIPDDVLVIGYVGSFVDYEGLDDLIEACGMLRSRGLSFRLLLVGGGKGGANSKHALTRELYSIACDVGIADWLIMPGRVPHDEVADYYSLIDIAPLPRKPVRVCELVSPLKPVEAMAMGKAIVVPDILAVSEAVQHERTGVIYERGSVLSLSEALADLIENHEKRARLGSAARAFILENRTWTASARKILGTLQTLALQGDNVGGER
ncbi:glycosyltransferase family 4 protein [Nitratireductor sp. GZWM139]|uniref:glycosyltransferase family 4 protein n=1 Tax=Nitratireductor sp. GZWM139 TaxID=2950541 RepID=UPI0024BE15C0|nr:glycosyltransferase family 4 protein [Nitratireductor sp. GZWM139]MDJ1465798.1 glycosyltransferase family 4 protein [Nitratireductor sp. GZWM139]